MLSCNGAGARCSSFLDRNGGQVQLYVKGKAGKRGTDVERERRRRGRKYDDFN